MDWGGQIEAEKARGDQQIRKDLAFFSSRKPQRLDETQESSFAEKAGIFDKKLWKAGCVKVLMGEAWEGEGGWVL